MLITFDNNTLDKAVRPERFPRDPRQPEYFKVHRALATGQIKGFFCETIMTLEGIRKVDRAPVFNSTRIRLEPEKVNVTNDCITTIQIPLVVEQPRRQPLHPETAARVRASVNLGLLILRAPRLGMFRITDPDGKYFLQDDNETVRSNRLTRYHEILREIELRDVGFSVAEKLGKNFARRDNVQDTWFHSLTRARDIHEQRAVERAIAEWADADSIAAHISYGIDLFCTEDTAKKDTSSSILNSTNRAWLQTTYGVTFVTISELAGRI